MSTQGLAVTSPDRLPLTDRSRDSRFLGLTLAISTAVFVGFWSTYFGPHLRGTYPAASLAVHVHGWSFFLWYLLLPLQASLVQARRVPLHRRLGGLSIALASLMVATGLLVIGVQMAEAARSEGPSFWSQYGVAIFSTLPLFGVFYTAALVRRRDRAWHRRLIIVASAAGMGAAVFRIIGATWGQVPWAIPGGIVGSNLFIVAGMAFDYAREKRVHPAYLLGLVVCVGVEVSALQFTATAAGRAVAEGLAWIGRVGGALY